MLKVNFSMQHLILFYYVSSDFLGFFFLYEVELRVFCFSFHFYWMVLILFCFWGHRLWFSSYHLLTNCLFQQFHWLLCFSLNLLLQPFLYIGLQFNYCSVSFIVFVDVLIHFFYILSIQLLVAWYFSKAVTWFLA